MTNCPYCRIVCNFKHHCNQRKAQCKLFIRVALLYLFFESWNCWLLRRWWWCYPNYSEGWRHGGIPRRPNSRATPQDLDQKLKWKITVPKMARQRGSDAR